MNEKSRGTLAPDSENKEKREEKSRKMFLWILYFEIFLVSEDLVNM